jgi:hypothetical protein
VSPSVGFASGACAFVQPDDNPLIVNLKCRNRKPGEGTVCLNLQLHESECNLSLVLFSHSWCKLTRPSRNSHNASAFAYKSPVHSKPHGYVPINESQSSSLHKGLPWLPYSRFLNDLAREHRTAPSANTPIRRYHWPVICAIDRTNTLVAFRCIGKRKCLPSSRFARCTSLRRYFRGDACPYTQMPFIPTYRQRWA